jgi:hypothetical protein
LLANRFRQPTLSVLAHRVRQQAGSYRTAARHLIVPTLCVDMHPRTVSVHLKLNPVLLDETHSTVGPASAGKRPVSTRHFRGVTPDAFPAKAGPTNPGKTRNTLDFAGDTGRFPG